MKFVGRSDPRSLAYFKGTLYQSGHEEVADCKTIPFKLVVQDLVGFLPEHTFAPPSAEEIEILSLETLLSREVEKQ